LSANSSLNLRLEKVYSSINCIFEPFTLLKQEEKIIE